MSRRAHLLAATALSALVGWGVLSFTTPAVAQVPTGGKVVGGSATITTAPTQVTVNQTTSRGVIDWQSFSIGQGSRVDFQQPGASAVTLNRVTGPDPSVIAGQLTANGQIVLVNGAGVFFANGAQVNVGALVASTANISDAKRFMAGGPVTFDVASPNANAGVVNNGSITVRDGGLVGLVGNMAANNGTINARLGRVTIGGAETFTVDLAGDGLINFQLGQPVSRQPTDAQGRKVALASNTGTINADGGVVQMTARAAGSVVDNVVNVGGAIRAQAVSQEGGVLVLGGEGATVNVTGTLDVSGKTVGQRGGQVIATASGGKVNVASTAVIDASGASGGGKVNIGGSYQGKGPVANARDTTVETGARINADATRLGDGGTVIVWSDNATVFGGTISAKGGLKGGDGGFAEVSGKQHLDYHGFTDLRAPLGTVGTLLLDPSDITISAGADANIDTTTTPGTIFSDSATSTLSVTTLQNALTSANVVVDAAAGTNDGAGSITVADPVIIPNGRTLTLNGTDDISINAAISTTVGGNANLVVLTKGGGIFNNDKGSISLGSGTLTLNATGSIALGTAPVTAGVVNFNAGGSVNLANANNAIGTVAAGPSSAGSILGNITIVSKTAMTVGSGGISAGGVVNIKSDGQVLVSGSVSSTSTSGSVTIASTGASATVGSAGSISSATTVDVSAPGQVLVDGSISGAGDVTITAGTATVNGSITSTAGGLVTITSAGQVVVSGTITSPAASGGVDINATGVGAPVSVTSTGNISADQTVSIGASGQIIVAGSIAQTGALGAVNLDADGADANGVGILLQAGSKISSAATKSSLPGVLDPGVVLETTVGSIEQTGGSIIANALRVDSGASVSLASPTNDVNFIAGSAVTSFRYVDADDISLGIGSVFDFGSGSVGFVQGITIGAGSFVDIAANKIAITTVTDTSGIVTGKVGTMFLGEGVVSNPTGSVVFRPLTAGTPMVIGGTTGTTLTEGALTAGIAAGTLRIGSIGRTAGTTLGGATTTGESAAGAITIQGLNLFSSAVGTLVLESGTGSITQAATGSLAVNALATAVVGGGSVVLTNAFNFVNTIAHVARLSDTTLDTQTGTYQFTGNGTVTVGALGSAALPLVGARDSGATAGLPANAAIVTTGGNVSLTSTASDTIVISSPLVAIDAVVTLNSAGPINNTATGVIDVGNGSLIMTADFGGINLSLAPVRAGVVNFNSADGNVLLTNAGNAISTLATTPSTAASSEGVNIIAIGSSVPMTVAGGGITTAGIVLLQSSGLLTVNGNINAGLAAALSGVGGVLQTAGTITSPQVNLSSGAGTSIIQTGGNIIATNLNAIAGDSVQLVSVTNDVANVFGSAGGDFRYVDANAVVLGEAGMGFGITIGAGRYLDISADGISIVAGAKIGAIAGSGGPADNPTGVTVLRPTTAGAPLVIGGTGGTGLTEAALVGSVRTGTLRIGSIGRAAGTLLGGATTAQENAAGAITIQGLDLLTSSFGASAIETLVLESAATGTAIGQTAPLRVGHLATAVLGSGAVELTQDNSVAGLAHIARISDTALGTQSGTFRYVDGTFIPVVTAGGAGTPLIGQRDSGTAPGAPPESAILTTGGDVTLVSRSSGIQFINGLAAVGATVRLSAPGDIFQDATGGVVANALLARAGSVDLSAAAGLNNVRFIAGVASGGSETLGDFRLINASSVTVPAAGVAGDSLVPTVAGVQAAFGSTLELAIATGDITVNAPLYADSGLILLRRVAGATGSEIILNGTSFSGGEVGPPNLVVLDLTGSADLLSGNFAALKTSVTPPQGTSPIAAGPNADGTIVLNNVNAGDTTMYLVGGAGSAVGGSGTFGLLGVYVSHANPIALTGSVRTVDPTAPHSVTAGFTEPFDATTFAGFYVRRIGPPVAVQTFNGCPIGSGICVVDIPPTVQRPPDAPGTAVGTPQDVLVIDFTTDRSPPTPLGLSSMILVNQGNEYFFNIDEERRKQRAARGGQ
ncbi:beta strand repeat-containing protein [Vineibacter terrae]|nr:filamentous hemagglutinin N-terminal domain-containing protein [Vineibacter terrae]